MVPHAVFKKYVNSNKIMIWKIVKKNIWKFSDTESALYTTLHSKPSNIMGVRFLENSMIVKTAIVETKGQWEEGGFGSWTSRKINSSQK